LGEAYLVETFTVRGEAFLLTLHQHDVNAEEQARNIQQQAEAQLEPAFTTDVAQGASGPDFRQPPVE
jgi:hypothetical protein